MDNLQKNVWDLVKLGGLSVNSKEGKIELSTLLEEAVSKKILPREILVLVDDIISEE